MLSVVTRRYHEIMLKTLSHISALQFWRLFRAFCYQTEALSHAKGFLTKRVRPLSNDTNVPSYIDRPLHVLTAKASLRQESKHLRFHVWSGPLPKGCIHDTGNGYYVSSPEFCFLQMARTMDLPALIALGFELCGFYAFVNGALVPCTPLTTVARLSSFLTKMAGSYGTLRARKALRFIAEKSASPMETTLVMLLCLPYRMGGYGLDFPSLNHRIDVSKKVLHSASDFYVCDLLWPSAKFALEYDSDAFHTGSDRINKDSIRRSDLHLAGIIVVSVTRQQVKSYTELEKLAHLVAEALGKRLCYKQPQFSQACFALRKALFDFHQNETQAIDSYIS